MFTVGQVPVQALSVTVVDQRGNVVSLTPYDRFELLLVDPDEQRVDTSEGVTSVVDGTVRYQWPTTTLFPKPGDYSLGIKCFAGAAVDFTEKAVIEVYREDG